MGSKNHIIPTLTEQLTANFYLWEKRGRGWQAYDYLVELEPPFEPFFFHSLPTLQPVIDDGHKPSLFERLRKGISKTPKTATSYSEETSLELKPIAFTDKSNLKEICISLPLEQKFSIQHIEQFLLNLSHCSLPLSFEIVGLSHSIRLQFCCREPDFTQVKQQLRAYFPDVISNDENDFLKKVWDMDKETVIVDFGLSQEFMRPIRTFKNLEPDPLMGIIAALENLEAGEIGLFQILFQGVHNPWTESILRSVSDGEGHPFFADAPEMVHLAEEKTKRPLFAVVVRVIAKSSRLQRAWELVRLLSSGISQVANPPSNELIPLTNEGYDDLGHKEDVLLRQTHRSGMLLSSEELASLVHPLSSSVYSQKLLREFKKTKAAPPVAVGHQLVLGENIHQGKKTTVSLSPEQRLKHSYIIGATGTGKSTLLLNMIIQDIKNGSGLSVLDCHGDLIDRILEHIPEERFNDVILLDPSDADYPIGLNILSAHSEIEKNVLASDLVGVFRRFSTSWGDQMNTVLANAILAFLESEKGGTLMDLKRFLSEIAYRKSFLETVKDSEVIYYWQKEFPLLKGSPQSSILTRLDTFLRPKLIRNMIAQKEGLNFQDILDNRKIFLVKLSHGLIGEENAYLLGSFIVSKLHQVATARQVKSPSERENFYLYIDEFQHFITPSMAAILSGARKYNLGLILAHQELRQLWNQDTEVANSVISNPGTRICFRLGDFDAKKLEDGFSFFKAQDLQNLGVGEAICRIERIEYDFNLKTFRVLGVDILLAKQRRDKLIALSREKYAARREEVEKIIEECLKLATPSIQTTFAFRQQTQKKTAKTADLLDGSELSSEERGFLEFVSQNPGVFVTQIYKTLQLSGYKGDRFKEGLIEKGLIAQEETREGRGGRLAKVLTLTDKGASILKKLSLAGKGGDSHKHLQQMFKEQAELYGWKARIEEKISGSLESVDVGLTKDDVRVAIEISATTKADQEMQNIRKCLEAGYDYIICVGSKERQLSLLKTEARRCFTARERERMRFYLPSQVKDFLPKVSSDGGIVSENRVVSEKISNQKQLLDTREASELLGISRNTLYEWVIQKKVPYVKVGRLTKFRREALEAWLKQRTQEEEKRYFF